MSKLDQPLEVFKDKLSRTRQAVWNCVEEKQLQPVKLDNAGNILRTAQHSLGGTGDNIKVNRLLLICAAVIQTY